MDSHISDEERKEIENILEQIASAETENMAELAKIAGLDICHDFAGSDLSGTDLSGLDLRGADFEETDFEGANLSHADLSGANLTGANLTNANLDWVNFSDANLTNANFSNASVLNIILTNANCQGVVGLSTSVATTAAKLSKNNLLIWFQASRVSGVSGMSGNVSMGEARVYNKAFLVNSPPNKPAVSNAILAIDINFSNYAIPELGGLIETVMMSVMIIGDRTLKLAYLKKEDSQLFISGSPEDIAELQRLINSKELTQIEGHNIAGIQETTQEEEAKISLIEQVKAGEKNLSGADLSGADLREVNLFNVDLSGADLRGANLRGARLIGARLIGANLRGGNLRGAQLGYAQLGEADLNEVDLIGARLIGANLIGANLRGADLRGANLRQANLTKVKLENITVLEARFGQNQGIDEDLQAALIEKGAIFEDAPGDRSSVRTPV